NVFESSIPEKRLSSAFVPLSFQQQQLRTLLPPHLRGPGPGPEDGNVRVPHLPTDPLTQPQDLRSAPSAPLLPHHALPPPPPAPAPAPEPEPEPEQTVGNWSRVDASRDVLKEQELYLSYSELETGGDESTGMRPKSRIGRCLANRTIGIAGDSLARQSVYALACMMRREGATVHRTSRNGVEEYKVSFPGGGAPGARPAPDLDMSSLLPQVDEMLDRGVNWVVDVNFLQAYRGVIDATLIAPPPTSPRPASSTATRRSAISPAATSTATAYACSRRPPSTSVSPTSSAPTPRTRRTASWRPCWRTPRTVSWKPPPVAHARADAHYGLQTNGKMDCAQYCLPGVPDARNSVMLRTILEDCVDEGGDGGGMKIG
ncbi:hypothetical protein BDK51DRAFT_41502, partial [Blyttiomyces helicus]